MKTRNAAGALIVSSLLLMGISAPASSVEDSANEELAIIETDSGFEFSDQSGRLSALRAFGDDQRNSAELLVSDAGIPYIAHELWALPIHTDHESDYQEAVESAQQNPRDFEVMPEGELAQEEKFYTSEEVAFDEDELRPRAAYVVSSESVQFHLHHYLDENRATYRYYAVLRDGELIDVHTEPTFADTGLRPETGYKYEIVATNEDPRQGVSGNSGVLATSRIIQVETLASEASRVTRDHQPNATGTVFTHGYIHTTFIPEARAPVGWFSGMGCWTAPWDNLEFGGDNRDFATPVAGPPNSHRTEVRVQVNYDASDPYRFETLKNVGPSTKYVNDVLVETKTESAEGITFSNLSGSNSYGQVVVNHAVGIPFCELGEITYHDEVRFYKNANTVEIVGWRFPVPNHEISVTYGMDWGWYALPAIWLPNDGFHCLLGYCTRDDYSQAITGV